MEDRNTQEPSGGTASALLKSLFALMALLVFTSMGYALWVVVEYWDRVGV